MYNVEHTALEDVRELIHSAKILTQSFIFYTGHDNSALRLYVKPAPAVPGLCGFSLSINGYFDLDSIRVIDWIANEYYDDIDSAELSASTPKKLSGSAGGKLNNYVIRFNNQSSVDAGGLLIVEVISKAVELFIAHSKPKDII